MNDLPIEVMMLWAAFGIFMTFVAIGCLIGAIAIYWATKP